MAERKNVAPGVDHWSYLAEGEEWYDSQWTSWRRKGENRLPRQHGEMVEVARQQTTWLIRRKGYDVPVK